MRHHGRTLLTLALLLGLAACAAPRPPVDVLADREAGVSRRVAAVATAADGVDTRNALDRLVWDDSQPTTVRLAAVDRLVALDEPGLRLRLTLRLAEVDNWDVLRRLCVLAAERGWTDATPELAASWARESTLVADADRPERAALRALHADATTEDVVWAVATGVEERDTYAVRPRQRVAAWCLTMRLLPHDEVGRRLDELDGEAGGAMVGVLRRAWRDFRILPATPQRVAWVLHVAAAGVWPEARNEPGLQPRHLPVMVQDVDAGAPRDELLRQLQHDLAWRGAGRHPRHDEGATTAAPDERLEAHADTLARADLLHLLAILDTLDRPVVKDALFAAADADLLDTTSEHGGVLTFDGYTPFEPGRRGNDHRFDAPAAMMPAVYEGLAHVHFHAQRHDNAAYAGPGGGDRLFADRFGTACLVLTFVDADTLNVDYYHEGGVVIDLGTLRR